jgi:hypothetical protein
MQMLNHLKPIYPDLELGTYTHVADSYHVYDHHYDTVNQMLEHDFVPVQMPMIKNDLITIDGEPTEDLLTLISHVETGKPEFLIFQEDDDDLYKWIYKNIAKTK